MNEKEGINEGIIQSVFYSDGLLKNNETNWPKQHSIYTILWLWYIFVSLERTSKQNLISKIKKKKREGGGGGGRKKHVQQISISLFTQNYHWMNLLLYKLDEYSMNK